MQSSYEACVIASYVARLIRQIDHRTVAAKVLFDWLRTAGPLLGLDLEGFARRKAKAKKRASGRAFSSGLDGRAWAKLSGLLEGVAGRRDRTPADPLAENVAAVAGAIALDSLEEEILGCVARCGEVPRFDALCDALVLDGRIASVDLLALLLERPAGEIWGALRRPGSLLPRLVDWSYCDGDCFGFLLFGEVRTALSAPNRGLADIEAALLGPALTSDLQAEDFDHLGEARDFLTDLLRGAIAQQAAGVNVLLYGPPGTGKTELTKLVARDCGLSLFAVGETDGAGGEPSRFERLDRLLLVRALARHRPNTALLVDEMEDFLDGAPRASYGGRRHQRSGSKVFLNRLLEETPVPILWTANAVDCFDPALVRRMSFCFEVKVPPLFVRRRIWRRAAGRHGFDLAPETIDELARGHEVAPGVVTGALKAARLSDRGEAGLRLALDAMGRALSGAPAAERGRGGGGPLPAFQPDLVNSDVPLARLTRDLAREGAARDFSLCLYGPPGTGKSAYLRHLAEGMAMTARQLRASDLQSKWLGETEQNIADAFARARADDEFLIIDEADSLLWDRGRAERSFEVSQVNELLTWMESHPLPFAMTTNLIDAIDQAAFRRFTFKIKFDYLTAAQVDRAFALFFGCPANRSARDLMTLTLGDFASVARRLRFIEGGGGAEEIAALLAQECRLKPAQANRIGFAAPSES